MWLWFHKLGSAPSFYPIAGRLATVFAVPAVVLLVHGLYGALLGSPADYQQGDGFRIIFVHVPAAWLSLMVYSAMAVAACIALIWRMKVAEVFITEAAVLGAGFTVVALITGMLWGKPMWGAYWVWDARLTSELILLFLYLGVLALNQAIEDERQAARACSLLALVGAVNVPIVHYSVEWWNTLHQGPTVTKFDSPSIDWRMLLPLLEMALASTLLFGTAVLIRMRSALLWRERHSRWVQELVRQSRGSR
jgi:heme exporter protein C